MFGRYTALVRCKEWYGKDHRGVNSAKLALISVGEFVFLLFGGVKPFNLNGTKQNRTINFLGNDEIETNISLWEINRPPRITKNACDVEFCKVIALGFRMRHNFLANSFSKDSSFGAGGWFFPYAYCCTGGDKHRGKKTAGY